MSLSYLEANQLRYRLTDIDLPEEIDRAQFNALLAAGVRDALLQELSAHDDRRHAFKDAAVEVSDAADWSAVAKRVRDRDAAIRSGAYIERVVA